MSEKTRLQKREKRAVPTKRLRANTAAKPNEAAMHPPMTIPKAPTNIIPQVQQGTSDNRPPPLEDAPVCKSTLWPNAGKISENLFDERKDWLLPPNYLNNDNKGMTGVTSPKPPIKEEPKVEEQSLTSPRTDKCTWDQIAPSAKIKKRKKIGMAIAKNNCNSKHCPNKRFRCLKQGAPRL